MIFSHHFFIFFFCHLCLGWSVKLVSLTNIIRDKIITANFFVIKTSGPASRNFERVGIVSTRIYTILFVSSMFTLGIFTRLQERTVSETVTSPSLTMVEKLRDQYSNTFSCPCDKITIPYKQFLTVQPIYHQVSYFVTRCSLLPKYEFEIY